MRSSDGTYAGLKHGIIGLSVVWCVSGGRSRTSNGFGRSEGTHSNSSADGSYYSAFVMSAPIESLPGGRIIVCFAIVSRSSFGDRSNGLLSLSMGGCTLNFPVRE